MEHIFSKHCESFSYGSRLTDHFPPWVREIDAGHTIVHENVTYDFHILPSGLVSPTCINLIGAGTVFHVPSFFKELKAIQEKGLSSASKRIFVSDRAHVCFDLHSVVDGLEEAGLGGRKVGTTGKGIGPCYSDKAARRGVRVGEILDEETFERKLRTLDTAYRARFGDIAYDVEEEIARFKVCFYRGGRK
jgi:adenylosuccinate synthase